MTAEDFLTDTPPWFIQFPWFPVFALTDYESRILPFLRATKRNFVNSRVSVSLVNLWEYEKLPELFADTFLDAGEIVVYTSNRWGTSREFVPFHVLFKTNAVRNCDKVKMLFDSLGSGETTESIIKWLEWKQHEPVSRRHLTLQQYACCEELLDMLIHVRHF